MLIGAEGWSHPISFLRLLRAAALFFPQLNDALRNSKHLRKQNTFNLYQETLLNIFKHSLFADSDRSWAQRLPGRRRHRRSQTARLPFAGSVGIAESGPDDDHGPSSNVAKCSSHKSRPDKSYPRTEHKWTKTPRCWVGLFFCFTMIEAASAGVSNSNCFEGEVRTCKVT